MRVLISSNYVGGAGGLERALYSMVRALGDYEVDVVVRRVIPSGFDELGEHATIYNIKNWRWRGSGRETGLQGQIMRRVVGPLRKRLLKKYDIYLQSRNALNLNSTIDANVRLLIPSGNKVPASISSQYDYVALQAPLNMELVEPGCQTILLPPPVYDLSPCSKPPRNAIPGKFLLTVFNPYGDVKGLDDLERLVDSAPLPIVWCHSQATRGFSIPKMLENHPNLIHLNDPSAAEMQYLYEECTAYICFSRSEGFGWSIADALRQSKPIISRRVGVLSFEEASEQEAPLYLMDSEWGEAWPDFLQGSPAGANPRELPWLSPEQFCRILSSLNRDKVHATYTDR